MPRPQVTCNCQNGDCFLRADMEWLQRNYSQSNAREGRCTQSHEYKDQESERLQRKSVWLAELGVYGTQEVSCTLKG